MARTMQGLRMWDLIPPEEGQCGGRRPQKERLKMLTTSEDFSNQGTWKDGNRGERPVKDVNDYLRLGCYQSWWQR